jgi:hypothetical protein
MAHRLKYVDSCYERMEWSVDSEFLLSERLIIIISVHPIKEKK